MKRVQSKNKKQYRDDVTFIQGVLLFYKKNGRDELIWRQNINPYKVLVSEIMLQQTQVARVIPKFTLWISMYPTLLSLKKAKFKDILILWQGLGYQRRAKALYDIAKSINKIPSSITSLCGLPGVGEYTASAICAFAFNTFSNPVLETNIRTALIEHFHQGENDIHDGVLKDDLSRLEKYTKVQDVGARTWYYALMDYGAHLKENNISHNKKSIHNSTQSAYKGSFRELRAKVLFAITHKKKLPSDTRTNDVIEKLFKEGYLVQKGKVISIKN